VITPYFGVKGLSGLVYDQAFDTLSWYSSVADFSRTSWHWFLKGVGVLIAYGAVIAWKDSEILSEMVFWWHRLQT
jgi:hypothetical protein